MSGVINIVMSEPPGPESHFVEVETDDGRSVAVGQWLDRGDGTWALRISADDITAVAR